MRHLAALRFTSAIQAAARRAYNRRMRRPLALDTPADIERLQIEGWRRMTPAEKAASVTALTRASITMAEAGIRHRHPEESADTHRRRLADILLGPDLANKVFGPLRPRG
jgi:hypothetical protein